MGPAGHRLRMLSLDDARGNLIHPLPKLPTTLANDNHCPQMTQIAAD
jgi:hypothetical protein